MPIKWSALKVSEAMDMVEEYANQILEPLEQAKLVVDEAQKIANLPEYMKQRLSSLETEIKRVTGSASSWSGQPYQGNIHRTIDMVRNDIPDGAIEEERKHLENGVMAQLV